MAMLFDDKEDWTFDKIEAAYGEIEKIATEELRLDVFPNQIELINAEQMLDAYSSVGMPVYYRHWSLGKSFISNEGSYNAGRMSLAYELVLNSNPCLAYLQDSNDMTMQALVIAHACFGHNAVFKGNVEFKRWTSPDSIIDELVAAKAYIARAEERHGARAVEEVLDAAHALMNHGVDTVRRASKPRSSKERPEDRAARRGEIEAQEFDLLWERTVPKREIAAPEMAAGGRLAAPEENLLYFIEKYAPTMEPWKREIVRIVRRIAQYFHPQGLTKVLNEGAATFTHYYCMNRLHEKGLISDSSWMNFTSSHCNVIIQPEFDDPRYSGINPYALGFAICRDIKRICENPTEEDKKALPHLIGLDWVDAWQEAFMHYNDASFISQYLSPKVARDFKLFALQDAAKEKEFAVSAIQDEAGFGRLRELLAEKHTRAARVPQIEVVAADFAGDRSLTLRYTPYRDRPLEERSKAQVLGYCEALWGYPVKLE